MYRKEWITGVTTKEWFSLYSTFKSELSLSFYLVELKHVKARNLFIRLRLGVSQLMPHKLRFVSNADCTHLFCPFCKNTLESEVHFVLICPRYAELREMYIAKKYYNCPSLFKLSHLFASTNKSLLLNLASYIFKAFQIRNSAAVDS